MATKLEQLREELNAKRAALKAKFDAYPNLDMPDSVASEIKAANDELTDLGKQFDVVKEMDRIAQETKAGYEKDNARGEGLPTNRGKSEAEKAQEYKSIGKLFTESKTYQEYNRVKKQGPSSEVNGEVIWEKALLNSTGFAPEAVRSGPVLPGALRRPVVADLIPQGRTSQNAILYMEETTTTNNAAPVAEGADKPESALVFTEKTSPVRKIATVLPITDELLNDEPAIQSYVEQRLRLFLQLAEEAQLVSGTGVAPQLLGMLNVVGILTQAKGADPTPDAVYKAMTAIQVNSFLDPSGAIFHPLDWQDIRLLRTADGMYIWGNPADPGRGIL